MRWTCPDNAIIACLTYLFALCHFGESGCFSSLRVCSVRVIYSLLSITRSNFRYFAAFYSYLIHSLTCFDIYLVIRIYISLWRAASVHRLQLCSSEIYILDWGRIVCLYYCYFRFWWFPLMPITCRLLSILTSLSGPISNFVCDLWLREWSSTLYQRIIRIVVICCIGRVFSQM